MIISDVVGDPLQVIASGPTVETPPDPALALQILKGLPPHVSLPENVIETLIRMRDVRRDTVSVSRIPFRNVIIGNNRTAVDAAARRARELGFEVALQDSDQRGIAREFGTRLAEECLARRRSGKSPRGVCLISGGEPVVELTRTELPRKGGRNQELVLSAACRLWEQDLTGLAILSGGTDGEDGPTDAAGGVFDDSVRQQAITLGLRPEVFLAINNSYPFLERTGGLLRTGPTHTNVMDLRVAVI